MSSQDAILHYPTPRVQNFLNNETKSRLNVKIIQMPEMKIPERNETKSILLLTFCL